MINSNFLGFSPEFVIPFLPEIGPTSRSIIHHGLLHTVLASDIDLFWETMATSGDSFPLYSEFQNHIQGHGHYFDRDSVLGVFELRYFEQIESMSALAHAIKAIRTVEETIFPKFMSVAEKGPAPRDRLDSFRFCHLLQEGDFKIDLQGKVLNGRPTLIGHWRDETFFERKALALGTARSSDKGNTPWLILNSNIAKSLTCKPKNFAFDMIDYDEGEKISFEVGTVADRSLSSLEILR